MVKLTFEFNETAVAKAGLTTDELLAEVRVFARENDIAETSYGVFEKDGEDALAFVGKIVIDIVAEKPEYIKFLQKLVFNVNGRDEDALAATKNWLKNDIIKKRPCRLCDRIFFS